MSREIFSWFSHSVVRSSLVFAVAFLLRILFRRLPKKYTCYLMLTVFLSLILPVIRIPGFSAVSLLDSIVNDVHITHTLHLFSEHDLLEIAIPLHSYFSVRETLLTIWLFITVILCTIAVFRVMKIRKGLFFATKIENGVYESENIQTPFLLGIFRPVIYLPSGIGSKDRKYILTHENCHIRYLDSLIKPFCFLLLLIHWFNPLLWAAYHILSNDLEMACDERTVDFYEEKDTYVDILVRCAEKRSDILLSLNGGDVKDRVRNILHYQESKSVMPSLFAGVLTVLLTVLPMFGFRFSSTYAEGLYTLSVPIENAIVACRFEEYPGKHEIDLINILEKDGYVVPLMSGTVEMKGFDEVYGNYLYLSHENGYRSFYCYLEDVYVHEGDHVDGDVIGRIGDTGKATGRHLGIALIDPEGSYVENLQQLLSLY